MESVRIASIDLGTNTFRLMITEIDRGDVSILLRESKVTGLGKNFDPITRKISHQSIRNGLDALNEFSIILSKYLVDNIRVVATSVVREAFNSNEFIEKAERILGSSIRIITGDKEAELTVLGVLHSVNHKGNKLIVDIGGGSTEFVFVNKDNKIESSISTDIGVVRYLDKYDFSSCISNEQFSIIYDDINTKVKEYCEELNSKSFDYFDIIITAGTPTTLAAIDMKLAVYNHDLVNNHVLSKENIRSIIYHLVKLKSEQRLKITGMHPGRENLIIPGGLIIMSLLDIYNKNHIIVSDGGLLEGIMYDILKSGV